jgi:Trk K+ transport system NAD-binding subunit
MHPLRTAWRRFRASWRDTLLLLREFRNPLLVFALTILGSGLLYDQLAGRAGEPVGSLAETMYAMLSLAFLQSNVSFPRAWYLQAFFFIMPVIGVASLAQGLTDFGVMLFNRRARGKEWEMAVASTLNNHIVLIGLGHLGFRVVRHLCELGQDVVVIALAAEPDLLRSVRALGVPVIEEDGTREMALISAGIQKARGIILCTQNDSLNLRIALKARSLNPDVEVTIRIFDDDFGASLQSQFGFHAMSATGMAAPLFAAMAAHIDITPPVTIDGQPHILANISIRPSSGLVEMSVLALEEQYHVSVVMLSHNSRRQFHPPAQEILQAGDVLTVFGEPEKINQMLHEHLR